MQSSDSKPKRTKRTLKDSEVPATPKVTAAAPEEKPKGRAKTAVSPLKEGTPAANHRAPAKRSSAKAAVAATPAVEIVTQQPTQPAKSPVTREAIAMRAYSFWEARGFQGGSSEEDWLRAEQELLA